MIRELPDALHFLGVELLDLATGPGDGHRVQEPQEVGAQLLQ